MLDNLCLIGPMGAGKTTIGRLLAANLRKEFVDIDHQIEAAAGVSISWIFDVEGEEGFRSRESKVLDTVLQRSDMVVATGGGAILAEHNRQLIRNRATVIYLKVEIDVLAKRLAHDATRPLLQSDNRLEIIGRLYEEREPLYQSCADLVVATDSMTPKQAAQFIIERMADGR